MLLDLRDVMAAELRCDVCVVGAGAAGLSVVERLLGSGLQVLLVESGYDAATADDAAIDDLNDGDNVGDRPVELRLSRHRALGGTTRLWAGQCVPLDDIDFEVRSWMPSSGWPIDHTDVKPWYRVTAELMGIADAAFDERAWPQFGTEPEPFDPRLVVHRATVWPQEVDVGVLLRSRLASSPTVRVLQGATATDLEVRESGREVVGLTLRGPGGQAVRVRPGVVVLANGAVEIPRLLLAAGGVGNDHDVVGRYLQEHPNAEVGQLRTDDHRRLQDRYALLYRRGRRLLPRLCLAREQQEAEACANAAAVLVFHDEPGSGTEAAREAYRLLRSGDRSGSLGAAASAAADLPALASAAWRRFRHGRSPGNRPARIGVQVFCEQVADPASRVRLGDRVDAMGVPVAEVDWKLSEMDLHTARVAAGAIGAAVAGVGLGRLELDPWLDGDVDRAPFGDSYHHIGTTRMGSDPSTSVVDRDCRVHGVGNLYLAGASVFPTSGWANPTFTAMALAARLGGHLVDRFERTPAG